MVVSAQTTPYAEKIWESGKLADYIYDTWGTEVYDIDGDGTLEILAARQSNSIIASFSGSDFTFEENFTGSTTHSLRYDIVDVAQVDDDAAMELVCASGPYSLDVSVIDATTKQEEVNLDLTGMDTCTLFDVDNDGKSEIIAGGSSVEVYNLEDQTLSGSSQNFSGMSMVRDIEVADVISGGAKEIVVLLDEFSSTGRLLMYNSQTFEELLNITLSGIFECLDLADVDSDGNIEILLGEGGVSLGSMSFQGHLYIYDSSGNQEYASADLGRPVYNVEVADLDNDGNLEIVITSDRVEIWNATTKESIWSTTNTIIHVGENDALELADLDGDGKLDIITRATSYSDNNRVLVYKVNGVVSDDGNGDDGGDNGDDTGNGDDGGSGTPFPGFVVLIFVAIAVAAIYRKKA
jgi:hypothetical protein